MLAGIKGISLIDYPETIAGVLYTINCNFHCPFCHNKELVVGQNTSKVTEERALEILRGRRGFIDGVVITGGEPTIHIELKNLLISIKRLGFKIKLDTNGYKPEVLQSLFKAKLVDFVAMDIKTSWKKYDLATSIHVDLNRLKKSIDLIKNSGIDHEFRTTCVPTLVDGDDIEEISRLAGKNCLFTLQQFQPENTINPDYSNIMPYSLEELSDFINIARKNTSRCRLIGSREINSDNK